MKICFVMYVEYELLDEVEHGSHTFIVIFTFNAHS